jgi:D-arabinose 1-dehydrogenase-like Zn-dependent alcohol dehydrogenase
VFVQAAGVGATDLVMLKGNYPFAPKIPLVLGYEAAGVVDAIGPSVTGYNVGPHVAALTVRGAFAEYLTREAESFLPVPSGVSGSPCSPIYSLARACVAGEALSTESARATKRIRYRCVKTCRNLRASRGEEDQPAHHAHVPIS